MARTPVTARQIQLSCASRLQLCPNVSRCRHRSPGPISEEKLERKLQRPWTALLILRGNRAETLIQHLRRLAECSVGQSCIDTAEVGVIQEIEALRTELNPKPIERLEFPMQRKIQL